MMETLQKITKDLKEAAKTLTDKEARYLVDAYYIMQDSRMRSFAQVREMDALKEPNDTISWFAAQNELLENEVKKALDVYSANHPVGKWLRAQLGIGPVIAAGLLAHIDIRKAPTAGHIWSYAGLDPTKEWKSSVDIKALIAEQGGGIAPEMLARSVALSLRRNPENILDTARSFQAEDGAEKLTRAHVERALKMRPWNAKLKVLCWKAGASFCKVSGNENSLYGRLYKEKKAFYINKNEAGGFADKAKVKLEKFNIGKNTEAYKAYAAGKLPDAHIHAMACRWAVKIFISHLHDVWYRHEFKKEPPKPFAIAILGHAHMIEPNHDIGK